MILLVATIARDWFDWSNAGVGIVGLALTLWAVWQAAGAKTAAREAQRAVYRRNASEDIERLNRFSAGLLAAIETEQYDLAIHQARDFISECMSVRERHRVRLGANGGRLDLAFDLVCEVSRELQAGQDRAALIQRVQRVVGDLSVLGGVLNRKIEEEPG